LSSLTHTAPFDIPVPDWQQSMLLLQLLPGGAQPVQYDAAAQTLPPPFRAAQQPLLQSLLDEQFAWHSPSVTHVAPKGPTLGSWPL
jgi:hypothetical protein